MNSMPEAERIIRENVAMMLKDSSTYPKSVILAYLREAGGDLSILADAPNPDATQK
jgi:hypothetical protein